MEQKTNQTDARGNELNPVLPTVFISDIAAYNEYDWGCNGGYFICPVCGKTDYTSQSEIGDIQECSYCDKPHRFV